MRRLLAAALAAMLLLVAPAAADTVAGPVAGDFVVSPQPPTLEPTPGGDCVIHLTATFSFAGSLEGSFTAPFTIVHEGACPPSQGDEAFLAYGTYDGRVTIGSRTRKGTFDFVFAGTIDEAGNARGTLLVLGGTGGLHDLHGALQLSGVSGVGGGYSGTLCF